MNKQQALDLIGQGYTPRYIESLRMEQVRTGKTASQTSPDPQVTEALASRWGITLAGAWAVTEED